MCKQVDEAGDDRDDSLISSYSCHGGLQIRIEKQ